MHIHAPKIGVLGDLTPKLGCSICDSQKCLKWDGIIDTVCHTGTSLDGYKSYRNFRPAKYHTGTPQ